MPVCTLIKHSRLVLAPSEPCNDKLKKPLFVGFVFKLFMYYILSDIMLTQQEQDCRDKPKQPTICHQILCRVFETEE